MFVYFCCHPPHGGCGLKLNNDQKMGAYEAGLTSRKSYYQEQNILSSNAKNSKYYAYTKGKFNASAIKGIQLDETQRAFYNFFREFALRTGINVELFSFKEKSEKYQGEQGSWDKNTKTIRVDINAGLKNVSDRAKNQTRYAQHVLSRINPYCRVKRFL